MQKEIREIDWKELSYKEQQEEKCYSIKDIMEHTNYSRRTLQKWIVGLFPYRVESHMKTLLTKEETIKLLQLLHKYNTMPSGQKHVYAFIELYRKNP